MTLRDALPGLPASVFADLLESDDGYLLVVDLPGATADSVEVSAAGGRVRVEARRWVDVSESFRYRSEERSPLVEFEFPLPPDASAEAAGATMARGVLELRLPKELSSGAE